ncbi:cell division initiation protein [Fontibacillus solani]|uniref:Cell division initiation protein n=1 Tax=Fontibacillus solani TaxID=1572857 RepID=A0A7W3XUN2_9BACL|nr:DivIVA domain-containing protein [Fontibacillus solani]MBA9088833.1 cell division initiation protein [Fontibacillus solani]
MASELNRIKSPKELGVTLTAMEIHDKQFSTVFRGYHQDEVNMFLDQIIKDYEVFGNIIKDLQKQLQNKVALAPDQLEDISQRLREVENLLLRSQNK